MALLWLRYGYVVAAAAGATAWTGAVLRLPCQPGEKKPICSSDDPSHLLPTAQPEPCLPWVQRMVRAVGYPKTGGAVIRGSNMPSLCVFPCNVRLPIATSGHD